MNNRLIHVVLLVYVMLIVGVQGCQRETPVEKAQPSQPTSTVDQAAQRAVDAVKTPMDEARGVEGTLEKAAGQTADTVKEAAP